MPSIVNKKLKAMLRSPKKQGTLATNKRVDGTDFKSGRVRAIIWQWQDMRCAVKSVQASYLIVCVDIYCCIASRILSRVRPPPKGSHKKNGYGHTFTVKTSSGGCQELPRAPHGLQKIPGAFLSDLPMAQVARQSVVPFKRIAGKSKG